jgi:microcystin-dependent protein
MADPFIGEIRLFGFPRVPDGWLACSGQSVSIGQYEALYTLIGTTYGGDGVQTFQLPDLRGRVPIGQGGTFVVGQNAGEEQHSLSNMEIPAHSHHDGNRGHAWEFAASGDGLIDQSLCPGRGCRALRGHGSLACDSRLKLAP